MLTLDDIKQEKWDKDIYVLPGRRTTECAKHASEVLAKINTLTARAEAGKVISVPGNK